MSIEEIQAKYSQCQQEGNWREEWDPFQEEIEAKGYYLVHHHHDGKFLVYADESFFVENEYYSKYQARWDSKNYFVTYKLWIEEAERNRQHRHTGSKSKREKIFARDNYQCCYCGSGEDLTIDHIEPWSIKRDDSLYNLQTLCLDCNGKKADKIIQPL